MAVAAEQAALALLRRRHGVAVNVEVGGEAELGVDLGHASAQAAVVSGALELSFNSETHLLFLIFRKLQRDGQAGMLRLQRNPESARRKLNNGRHLSLDEGVRKVAPRTNAVLVAEERPADDRLNVNRRRLLALFRKASQHDCAGHVDNPAPAVGIEHQRLKPHVNLDVKNIAGDPHCALDNYAQDA